MFWNYDLNKIVKENHPLRKVNEIVSFGAIAESFNELAKETGRPGYGVETGIRSLFLQFYYDLSDREMQESSEYHESQ